MRKLVLISSITVNELISDFNKNNAKKFMEQETNIRQVDPSQGYTILINSVKGTPHFSKTATRKKLNEWNLDEFKEKYRVENVKKRRKQKLTKKTLGKRIWNRMTRREKKSTGLTVDEFADAFVQMWEAGK